MKLLLIYISCFLFINSLIFSKDNEPLYYLGIGAAYQYNSHLAGFTQLPGIPNCCPEFQTGNGSGFNLGLLFEIPFNEKIYFGAKINYSSLSAELLRYDKNIGNTSILFNGIESVEPVTVNHIIKSYIDMISLEPYVRYYFIHGLSGLIGFQTGYLTTGKFEQWEKITNPSDVIFLNEMSAVRNRTPIQSIPDLKRFQLFLMLGLGYDLQVGINTYLTPEIKFFQPLLNISSVNWKVAPIQLGMTLRYPIYPTIEKINYFDTTYYRDTATIVKMGIEKESLTLVNKTTEIKREETGNKNYNHINIYETYSKEIPKTALMATSIEATGISSDGERTPNPTLIIEENEMEESFPLLPHVFFKKGNSNLEKTDMILLTKEQAGKFTEDSLPWRTLDIYSQLLNIIGSRAKKSGETLTIIGCNNGMDIDNNLSLSESRALAVKEYLVNIWEIPINKINIQKQGLPDNPGNINIDDGQKENQRAEIKSSNFELLRPVLLKDILKTSNPPLVEIYPKIQTEAPLRHYEIIIQQQDKTIRKFEGDSLPDKLIWEVQQGVMPQLESPVNIIFNAEDIYGNHSLADTRLMIKQLTIKKKRYLLKDDKRIEKFSLIVFDYDKSEIKPHHKRILDNIKSKINLNSLVTIAGYADRTGDFDYNRDLAKRRCDEVQKYLHVPENNLKLKPMGSEELLYENNIPQGRSYCRTVIITIETPVEKK